MLSKQNLEYLNSFHCDFHGTGGSAVLFSGIIKGYQEAWPFFVDKKYDAYVSVVKLDMDWCIAVKVILENKAFLILNVYISCQLNEDEYLARHVFF